MTKATARALDAIAARAFPILCRVLAVAGALAFIIATARLVRDLAAFN